MPDVMIKISSKRYNKLANHTMKKSLSFIRDLKNNNNTEWFHANRPRYDEAKAEFLAFIEILVSEIGLLDPDLGPVSAKSTLFRINRDIRFSKDKSPYKTNFGSFIIKGGKKTGNAGYYFHLDPAGTFIGGGVYHPEAEILKKVRQEIYENPEEFREIISNKKFRNSFGEMYDDQLKTGPKGFPKDFEHMDLIKYKSYIVSKSLDEKTVTGDELIKETLEAFRLMHPLIRFINFGLE
jgi:uncharacterized protein (TIGR02453 family)